MHPAISIILFSTLSGAGLGLAFWTGLLLHPPDFVEIILATLAAIILTGGGLCCSVFHLRRPLRAWRAFSQWRSSWLSREGILAPAALAALLAFAVASLTPMPGAPWWGLATALLSAAAVFATAMIYAQLRAVPSWNTTLTPLVYLSAAGASGAFLATALFGSPMATGLIDITLVAIGLNLVAWGLTFGWWTRLDLAGDGATSTATATGLGHLGQIRPFEPPHTGSNYLLDEMGYVVARRHARKLRMISLLLGCLLATAILAIDLLGPGSTTLAILACLAQLAGTGIARWLFFAEARHVVTTYYR